MRNQEVLMGFLKEVCLYVLSAKILYWNPESDMHFLNSHDFLGSFCLGLGLSLLDARTFGR